MTHRAGLVAIALAATLAAPDLSAQETQQDQGSAAADAPLVATVGETEITGADVTAVIDTLPPRLRQQPPQLLLPMAVDSLVLRELVVQDARAQGLAEDPEVQELVAGATEGAENDALVQVYLRREIEERVTDEAVQGVYDDLTQNAEGEVPPLEEVRSQIEQRLGQDALAELRTELGSDVEIVFYGPDGQPTSPGEDDATGSGSGQSEPEPEDGEAGGSD